MQTPQISPHGDASMLGSGNIGENGLWVSCACTSVINFRVTVHRLLLWGWVIRLGGGRPCLPDDTVLFSTLVNSASGALFFG